MRSQFWRYAVAGLAGLGVAVSNAHEEVKQAAGMVVASNLENGVAELIEMVMSGELLKTGV